MSGGTAGGHEHVQGGGQGRGRTGEPAGGPPADWMAQARLEGLLPAEAALPARRPWPVVLLTGLAAWLAVPPLLFALALLFGERLTRGPMDLVVGVLMAGLAVVLLRGRDRALFLEQLAVPVLIVGLFSLGHGLAREMTDVLVEAVLLLIAVVLIVLLPAHWLRQLLGAAAAVLMAALLWELTGLRESRWAVWVLAHGVGAALLALMALQFRLGRDQRGARAAAVMEPALSGAWVTVAGLLLWSAGPTFLLGASMGVHTTFGQGISLADPSRPVAGHLVAVVSAGLAVVGALVLHRAWRLPQFWRLLPMVAVLAALATRIPALGASLALLAVMVATGRPRLAILAAGVALWALGSFYNELQMPLQHKALLLVAAGAVMGAWARWIALPPLPPLPSVPPSPDAATRAQERGPGMADASRAGRPVLPADAAAEGRSRKWPGPVVWLAVSGVLVLGGVNLLIAGKERLIRDGRPVFVRLGPVDPRSLMQGDYMQLSYTLPGVGWGLRPEPLMWGRRPVVAVRLDERGVVQSPRLLEEGEAVPPGMVPLQLTPSGSGWTLVSDAWLFREGEADRWAAARYGEFRLQPDGRALLVNLVGENLEPL